MKKLLIFLLIVPFFALCQETPKGVNTISVQPITFDQLVTAILAKNIIIEKKDIQDKTIVTEFVSDKGFAYRLYIRVNDSSAFITGQLKLTYSMKFLNATSDPNKTYPIENRGMKGSELRKAWGKMEEFARTIPGLISFSKS